MNEPSWEPVPYTLDLADGILALHRRAWGELEITRAEYHRWQYQENPAGPALSTVARERSTGELIGQFGAIPLRASINGEPQIAALALNVVTDPAYRRQGVFARLGHAANGQMAKAGIAFAFALPNENSFPGFVRHLGYHHVGDVPLLVRPVNVRRLVAQRLPLPGLSALAAALSRPFAPPLPSSAPPVDSVTVVPVERFDSTFDVFWQRICSRQRVMVVRDAAYLDWRFRQIPLRRYFPFQAVVADDLAGYIVLRRAEILGMRAGLVVDFVVDPAFGERVGVALLAQALAHFASENVDLLASLMLPHVPEYGLLRRTHFWPVPRTLLPQRFRLVARGGPVVRKLEHWFLTMGDYDVA